MWHRTDKHTILVGNGSTVLQLIKYMPANAADWEILSVILTRNSQGGAYQLVIKFSNKRVLEDLCLSLQSHSNWISEDIHIDLNQYILYCTSDETKNIANCLYCLGKKQQIFEEIRQDMAPLLGMVTEDLDLDFSDSTDRGGVMAPLSLYEQMLAAYSFPKYLIPKRFLCNLSRSIMVDPVFDSCEPNIYYERQNLINFWQRNDNNSSVSWSRRQRGILQPAVELQQEIQAFVLAINQACDVTGKFSITLLNPEVIIKYRSEGFQREYEKRYGLSLKSNLS